MKSSRWNQRRLGCIALAAVLAAPVLGGHSGTARGDSQVRFGSRAGIGWGGPRARIGWRGPRARIGWGALRYRPVRPFVARPYYSPRMRWWPRYRLGVRRWGYYGRSSVWGWGMSSPFWYGSPYWSPYYGAGFWSPYYYVPGYYDDYYYSAPRAVAAPPPSDLAPVGPKDPGFRRLDLGAFAGQARSGIDRFEEVGLVARYYLSRRVALEGELAKSRSVRDEARRSGGAVVVSLGSIGAQLSPQLGAGVGLWDQRRYLEAGGGVAARVNDRLSLTLDLRSGARAPRPRDPGRGSAVFPAGTNSSPGTESEPERYLRGRLSAVLHF